MCAVVAAVDDGRVKASEKLEVAAACPRLHNVESVLDAELHTRNRKAQYKRGCIGWRPRLFISRVNF